MSRENVELVRRMYEKYLAGDGEGALDYFHPDVIVDFSVRVDTAGTGRGREEVSRITGSWIATWDDYHETLDEIHDLGDLVCVVSTQSGRGKGSGVQLDHTYAGLYEVRNGQITRITMYSDPAKALEAAKQD